MSSDKEWSAIFGIQAPGTDSKIEGNIQLYHNKLKKQQLLEGYCCTFADILN